MAAWLLYHLPTWFSTCRTPTLRQGFPGHDDYLVAAAPRRELARLVDASTSERAGGTCPSTWASEPAVRAWNIKLIPSIVLLINLLRDWGRGEGIMAGAGT